MSFPLNCRMKKLEIIEGITSFLACLALFSLITWMLMNGWMPKIVLLFIDGILLFLTIISGYMLFIFIKDA